MKKNTANKHFKINSTQNYYKIILLSLLMIFIYSLPIKCLSSENNESPKDYLIKKIEMIKASRQDYFGFMYPKVEKYISELKTSTQQLFDKNPQFKKDISEYIIKEKKSENNNKFIELLAKYKTFFKAKEKIQYDKQIAALAFLSNSAKICEEKIDTLLKQNGDELFLLNLKGWTKTFQNENQSAEKNYLKMILISKAKGDQKYLASAYSDLANIYYFKGDLAKEEKYNADALKIFRNPKLTVIINLTKI